MRAATSRGHPFARAASEVSRSAWPMEQKTACAWPFNATECTTSSAWNIVAQALRLRVCLALIEDSETRATLKADKPMRYRYVMRIRPDFLIQCLMETPPSIPRNDWVIYAWDCAHLAA